MSVTAEQILDDAAKILADPARWHQGYYSNDEGNAYCAMGAIAQAYRQHGYNIDLESMGGVWTAPAVRALESVLREHYPQYIGRNLAGVVLESDAYFLAMWNDEDGRLHAEVMEAFEKARAVAAEKRLAA